MIKFRFLHHVYLSSSFKTGESIAYDVCDDITSDCSYA